ncbi:MAG TPA: aldo/keto reductase [Candidatus Ozemobacteraceae bacterium]
MKWNRLLPLFALIAHLLSVAVVQAQPPASMPAMEYVTLEERPGGPSLRVSRLILGTDHLGKIPNERTLAVLNEAVRLGINTFDTAPIYTDSIEERLAAWLRTTNRQDLHVITKGGFPRDLGPGTYYSRLRGSREQILANVSEEARKSRSKYDRTIAIYLMHRDDADFWRYKPVDRPQTPVRTILEALSAPILRRTYCMVGVSNWATPRVDESQRVAGEHPELVRPVCNSPYFSLLEMGPVTIHSGGVQVRHDEMMDPGFQKGVKIMSYSPLGGFSIFSRGWETARANALALKNAGDRYWGNVFDAIFHEANAKRFRRAMEFTAAFNKKHGTSYTLDQMANAYILAHPRADFLIIGPRSVEQLHRTVQSLELAKRLTPADLEFLYRNPD